MTFIPNIFMYIGENASLLWNLTILVFIHPGKGETIVRWPIGTCDCKILQLGIGIDFFAILFKLKQTIVICKINL